MSKTTMTQRLRSIELGIQAAADIREAASEAWNAQIEEERVEITRLLKRTLGREPDSFPDPIKGTKVNCEVDGLLFTRAYDRNGARLGLIVTCAVCGEAPTFYVDDYASLGRLLANAEADRRCHECVEHNRRVA